MMMAFDSSMSSRSFREMLLTASIMEIFSSDTGQPAMRAYNNSDRPSVKEKESSETNPSEKADSSGSLGQAVGSILASTSPIQVLTTEQNSSGPAMLSSDGEASTHGRADPFAHVRQGGVEYKSMAWWQAGMVMVAETVSLGILSLPLALSVLGIVPGLILLIGLGGMATYTGYVIGQLKIFYPHVHSMADAGEILCGKIGREVIGAGQLLFIVFIMGGHLLAFSVMMNAITEHATCTTVFMVVGTVLSLLFTLPRTLKNLSYCSIASFVSIIAAILITMIGVSITRPGFHLDAVSGDWIQEVRLFPAPDVEFHEAFLAMANIVFAYAGHVAFFSFASELKDPKDFPKSLALLQISDISMYIVTAVVIYYYAGDSVASPAFDSASPLIRKIAYGAAMPTIVIAGVVNGHVAVKYVFVRLLRNHQEEIMHQKSAKGIGYWVAICTALWFLAWIIAEGIPVFNDLLGVTSALFASWFTFGLSGIFWCHMNLKRSKSWWRFEPINGWTWKQSLVFAVNCLNIAIGATICVVGLYASGKGIAFNSEAKRPFSCEDNSGFRRP